MHPRYEFSRAEILRCFLRFKPESLGRQSPTAGTPVSWVNVWNPSQQSSNKLTLPPPWKSTLTKDTT